MEYSQLELIILHAARLQELFCFIAIVMVTSCYCVKHLQQWNPLERNISYQTRFLSRGYLPQLFHGLPSKLKCLQTKTTRRRSRLTLTLHWFDLDS